MGKVVLIDGMDGSGKSTLIGELLVELSEERGKSITHQTFPSHHRAVGAMIRDCFIGRENIDERAMLPLFIADGLDLDPELVEKRDKSDFLVLDRHPMVTTWAYQAPQHSIATLAAMTNPENFEVVPDVVFILDVPAEVAMERREKRKAQTNELFEKGLEHTEILRSRYLAFAAMYEDNRPIAVLDGTLSTEELVAIVVGIIDEPL